MARELRVEIVGDAASLEKAFGRAEKTSGGFGRALGTASKFAAGALVGLGAAAKLGFDELMEAQKVSAQTAAVLKSTGGAANIAQKGVEDLSGALSAMSGVDDEAIQSGQNMLLTFTKIRNEVGAGNDIFNQATKATLDMSVAMGKDLQGSAILVGKALNDPIKGMSALSKVGIQFTEEQKKMIGAMVESGNTMGAQKMILKELETQFGGSAKAAGETLAGQLNIAKNALSEMAASMVEALLPAMMRFAEIGSQVAAFLVEHKSAVQAAAIAIAALSAGILVLNVAIKAWTVVTALARAATLAWTAAQWLLNAALSANPIGIVIIAIAALVTGVIIAYKESETFRRIVHAALEAVAAAARTLAAVVRTVLSTFEALYGWIKRNAGSIGAALSAPFHTVAGVIRGLIGLVQSLINLINSIPIPKFGGSHDPLQPPGGSGGRYGGGTQGFGGGDSMGLAMAGGGIGGMGMGGGMIENHTHVYLDGKEISHTVRKEFLEYGRRNSTVISGLGVRA